VNIKLLF